MVLALNLKWSTASQWWTRVFTIEPSFTSHTLQERREGSVHVLYLRFCSVINYSQIDMFPSCMRPGSLDSATVATLQSSPTSRTLNHKSHSLNCDTPSSNLTLQSSHAPIPSTVTHTKSHTHNSLKSHTPFLNHPLNQSYQPHTSIQGRGEIGSAITSWYRLFTKAKNYQRMW